MKTIVLLTPGTPEYANALAFAQRIYREALSFQLTHGPELFLAILDGDAVSGVIGLNMQITNSLFVRNPHIQEWLASRRSRTIAEQSVLALERTEIGLPLLFAVLAALAETRRISGIIFAGIDVSLRTIAHLGLSVEEIAPADRQVLRKEERTDYAKWFSLYTPIVCVVNTADATTIAARALRRWHHRITLSRELAETLAIPVYLDEGLNLR